MNGKSSLKLFVIFAWQKFCPCINSQWNCHFRQQRTRFFVFKCDVLLLYSLFFRIYTAINYSTWWKIRKKKFFKTTLETLESHLWQTGQNLNGNYKKNHHFHSDTICTFLNVLNLCRKNPQVEQIPIKRFRLDTHPPTVIEWAINSSNL